MLELIREHELTGRFRTLKKQAKEVLIAVPFWGDGAIKMLGLGKGQSARILCNLASGACNPFVIEKLKGLKGVEVRTNPRLHAKLYAASTFVIIGSSNASNKGLTLEGEMAESWIEANVLSDDPGLIKRAVLLFEEVWKRKGETTTISAKGLEDAKTRWKNRPRLPALRSGSATTLLAACREHPELFESVFVAAYDESLGPGGKKRLAALKRGAQQPASGLEAADFRNAWGYQFSERIKPGSWLIDLDCKKPDMPKVWGCCQMTGLRLKVPDEYDLAIALRGKVQLPEFPRPLRLSFAEKQALTDNSKRILNEPRVASLTKVIQIIDRANR